MSDLPREPEAFTETVARFLRKQLGKRIRITGPLEIRVSNQTTDLDNLYRAVQQEPEKTDKMLEDFAQTLFNEKHLAGMNLPFELVANKVLPQICPFRFFRGRQASQLAHQLYLNDTVILYMIDLNGAATPVTSEQLVRWGASLDDLDQMARSNLAAHQPELELTVFHAEEGSAAVLDTGDGYDASRLLLEQLHLQVAPELGGNFLAAIPNRDVFIAFPLAREPFLDRLRDRIRHDYHHLPYPITDELFLVTRDGVAPWREAA